jgi:hypothetical protein
MMPVCGFAHDEQRSGERLLEIAARRIAGRGFGKPDCC